jgi:hypothetical protein
MHAWTHTQRVLRSIAGNGMAQRNGVSMANAFSLNRSGFSKDVEVRTEDKQ